MREKLNNLVLFDKETYTVLNKQVPNYKLITPSVLSERLKIRGSLARSALKELEKKGQQQTDAPLLSFKNTIFVARDRQTI